MRSLTFFRRFVLMGLLMMLAMPMIEAFAADKVIRFMTTERDPKTQAVLKEIIAEFEAKNPGVRISPEFSGWSGINKKLLASLAAGDPPQVVTVHDFYIFELADKGIIRPVDDVIDKIGRDDFFPITLAGYTQNGKTWGVPFSIGQNVLWYRADLYKKYGLKEPKTWAEFKKNAEILNKAGRKGGKQEFYGTAIAAAVNWHAEDTLHNWMWTNGATMTNAEGKLTLQSKQSVDTFAFMKDLAKYAPPGITTYGHQEIINAFVTGATAHTEYGYRILNHMERQNPKLLDVAVPFLHPVGPDSGARVATHLYLKGWAIIKDAKYQKETEDFLVYLETGDRKIRMMHSVPIHYWPPRKSVENDPEFLNNALMKTPAGQRALKLVPKGLATGVFALKGTGTVVPKVGPMIEARVLSKTYQRILITGMSPEASLKEATKEAESIK